MEDDLEGAVIVSHDYMDSGWNRWLPMAGTLVHMAIAYLDVNEIRGELGEQPDESMIWRILRSTLAASLWEEEDEMVRESRADPDPEELVWADEILERRSMLRQVASDLGNGLETVEDLVNLMEGLGLSRREYIQGKTQWRLALPLCLPEEKLPLTVEQREHEAEIRWREIHDQNAQAIIRRFVDEGLNHVETTLESLACDLDVVAESARAAVEVLLKEGDFSASADIATLLPETPFTLSVDWDLFNKNRISVRFNMPGASGLAFEAER